MKIAVEIASQSWHVDPSTPVELAIALDFSGDQPRAFGLPRARAYAVEAGDFVGDTRRGGSANCETVELTPHGNGTHTEGVGHLTEERIAVGDAAPQPLIPAALISAPIRRLDQTGESYAGQSAADDQVICRADLEEARKKIDLDAEFYRALIIRVELPTARLNDYSGKNPPYLTTEAARWLRERRCHHLLVELPSVDRESDGGTLPNHHLFFDVRRGQPADPKSRRRTITEMIAVPPKTPDGPYVLSLRFPRFELDAAPSRPIIYPLERAT